MLPRGAGEAQGIMTMVATRTHTTHMKRDSSTTASASAATTSTLQLPTSTITALGLGFVAAAIFVVFATALLRVVQVRRAVRAAVAQGESVTFGQMWERWGGWWGFLFSQQSDRNNDSLWNRRVRIRIHHTPKPKMWEVDVQAAAQDPKLDFDLYSAQPISAVPYTAAMAEADPTLPEEVAISVLILMPSPLLATAGAERGQPGPSRREPPPVISFDQDGEPEVPDLMLGTTHFMPTVPLATVGLDPKSQHADDDKDDGIDIQRSSMSGPRIAAIQEQTGLRRGSVSAGRLGDCEYITASRA